MNKFQKFMMDAVGYSKEDVKCMTKNYIVEHSKELGLYEDLLEYVS